MDRLSNNHLNYDIPLDKVDENVFRPIGAKLLEFMEGLRH